MCGIAGIYRYRGEGEDSAIVQAMLTRLVDDLGFAHPLAVARLDEFVGPKY